MRLRRLLVALTVTAFVVGCDGVTSSDGPAALLGRWAAPAEPVGGTARGAYTQTLEFGARNGYRAEWRMTGAYPGQQAGEVSSYGRTVGRFRTEGDRLVVVVDSVVTWDRFFGPSSPEQVARPNPAGAPDPDTRFEVAGDVLILRYLSYPADAPVPTTAVYRRAP